MFKSDQLLETFRSFKNIEYIVSLYYLAILIALQSCWFMDFFIVFDICHPQTFTRTWETDPALKHIVLPEKLKISRFVSSWVSISYLSLAPLG